VGGEFPKEYAACDVPHNQRGARLAEGVQVLRKFFSGQSVSHHGRFYGPFEDVPMYPPPDSLAGRQSGLPAGRKQLSGGSVGWVTDIFRM
jgi:alkanesulfonate monooxygenase SsuD/methylene tetrahydromethanopterin reductase-like flavin-dependent oxidoreductase (luciferase family)